MEARPDRIIRPHHINQWRGGIRSRHPGGEYILGPVVMSEAPQEHEAPLMGIID